MTTYEEIISRVSLLSDNELRNVFERCSDIYNDRQRIKRGILKKELTDKLQAIMNEILDNNFTLGIVNPDSDCHDTYSRIMLEPNENFEIELS